MTTVYLAEDLSSTAIRHFAAYKSGYVYRRSAVVREASDTDGSYTHGNTYLSCAMRLLSLLAVVAAVVALCTAQKCPDDLGPHGVAFIPYPGNCTAYYRCTKLALPKVEICPSYGDMGQLCYNDKLKICDWSANVRCCNPFIPEDNPGDNPGNNPGSWCPSNGKTPHWNCLKYIKDGESFCCGKNWAFNQKICQCDLIRNVKSCQPSPAQLQECNRFTADRVSSSARLTDLVYGDNQPVALNDDSFDAPSAK